ncbi:MAG: HIT domain-containing protein [Patescibacteria group bacterium]
MDDFYCDEVISGRTKVKVVFETDRVLAFHHTKPHWPVHIVVIPKTHIPDILSPVCDEKLLSELFSVIRRVAVNVVKEHGSCRIITNVGGYQDSKHLHWHVSFGDPSLIVRRNKYDKLIKEAVEDHRLGKTKVLRTKKDIHEFIYRRNA